MMHPNIQQQQQTSIQILQSKIKGKIGLLPSFNLPFSHQIIASLSCIFNFTSDPLLNNTKSSLLFIDKIIKNTQYTLQLCNYYCNRKQLNKILRTIWPLLISKTDPIKIYQIFKYLQKNIQLTKQHICILIHYAQKYQDRIPQYYITKALQYFNISSRIQIQYHYLANNILGQLCIQQLLQILKFNYKFQLQKYSLYTRQQYQQLSTSGQGVRLSKMNIILNKIYCYKIKVVIKYINSCIGNQINMIKIIDQWIQYKQNQQCMNIFHTLKIILIMEAFYQMKNVYNKNMQNNISNTNTNNNTNNNSNKNILNHESISKILIQTSKRLLNRLFNYQSRQKILIIQWILSSKIWQNNQQLKKCLISILIALLEILQRQEQNQDIKIQQMKRLQKLMIVEYIRKIKIKLYKNQVLLYQNIPKFYHEMDFCLLKMEPLSLMSKQKQKQRGMVQKMSNSYSNTGSISNTGLGLTGTVTLSISKLQVKRQSLTNMLFNRIIKSIYNDTQNLQLHKVYLSCLCLKKEINMIKTKQKQQKQKQKDSNQNKNSRQKQQSKQILKQKQQQRSQQFMKIFHRIIKSIQKYIKIFHKNNITTQLSRLITFYPLQFKYCSTNQLNRLDFFPDIELIINKSINLQNISTHILKNSIYYTLTHIYQIQLAQKNYINITNIDINNSSNNSYKIKDKKKTILSTNTCTDNANKYLQQYIKKQQPYKYQFIKSLFTMILNLTKKQQQRQFLFKLIFINNIRINNIMFINLIYYTLIKHSRSVIEQKQSQKRKIQLNVILKQLFVYYLLRQQTNKQIYQIIQILITTHKILQNWRLYTRKNNLIITQSKQQDIIQNINANSNINNNINQNISIKILSYQQQKSIPQQYWKILINSVHVSKLHIYAKHFQHANLIKQSIYIMQLYFRRQFPIKYTQQQVIHMYNLYARLENRLNQCKKYVMKEILQKAQKNKTQQELQIQYQQQYQQLDNQDDNIQNIKNNKNKHKNKHKKQKLKWYQSLIFLNNNPQSQYLSHIIYINSIAICQLQDTQQIDKILHQLTLVLQFYKCIINKTKQSYQNLSNQISKCNSQDLCLSIVQCLLHIRDKYNRLNSTKKTQMQILKNKQIINKISYIIYNEKLRYKRYQQLDKLLQQKTDDKKQIQQLRAGIKLHSQLGNYDRVMLLYKFLSVMTQNQAKLLKQQLKYYDIQAQNKSVMYLSVNKVLAGLDQLIYYIKNQKNPQMINKKSTYSIFSIYKLLCDKYTNLSYQQQQKLLKILTIYAHKVYQINNKQLTIQAIFFILKFIMIQSQYTTQLLNKQIFQYDNYNADIYQPHKDFLIINITDNQCKNMLIYHILVKIAVNTPIYSSWWIFSLYNHKKLYLKQKNEDDLLSHRRNKQYDSQDRQDIDKNIQKIGKMIKQDMKKRSLDIQKQLDWISWLAGFQAIQRKSNSMSIKYQNPPKYMLSPFNKQIQLLQVISIDLIGTGKSKPILIKLRVKNTSNMQQTQLNLIRKDVGILSVSVTGYRTQSSLANFLKNSNLLSPQTTYSILHLSKRRLLIQYISHEHSLNDIMQTGISQEQRNKIYQIQQQRPKKIIGPIYDKQYSHIKFNLSNYFMKAGPTIIKSWWGRYNNFIRSFAEWSYMCHIVGLGDRHNNNILVKVDSKLIHIDFQFVFGSGKRQPIPQWVPIRLTRGIMSELSIIQPYGLLYFQFIKTAQRYKQNGRQIWHAESYFSFVKKAKLDIQINKRALLLHPYQDTLKIFKVATNAQLLKNMFAGWKCYA